MNINNIIFALLQMRPDPGMTPDPTEEDMYHFGESWSFWGDFVGGWLVVIIVFLVVIWLWEKGRKTE